MRLTLWTSIAAEEYFIKNVYPVVTPMAVDSSRPFPLIRNKTLNIGAMVRRKGGDGELEFATVQVPAVLDRLVPLPGKTDIQRVILLEEVIERNISKLFLHYDIVCAHPYRITRNGDLTIQEDEAEDLLKEIEKQVKKRQRGDAIRLEVATLLSLLFAVIPFLGWVIAGILVAIFGVIEIVAIVWVLQGKAKDLPLIDSIGFLK